MKQEVSLFERGRDSERGRSPLSLTHPSPAINSYEFLLMLLAGEGFTLKVHIEGTGVRLSHTKQKQTEFMPRVIDISSVLLYSIFRTGVL
jgi:hypothetical protein